MSLYMPDAMEDMPITNLRRFCKLMDQDRWRNVDNMRIFFQYIPQIREDLKAEWNRASLDFQKGYKDLKFDSSGHVIMDKDERNRRKAHNARLMNAVKKAKARYDRFEKRIPKLKELQQQYT